MNGQDKDKPLLSRRSFLARACGVVAVAGAGVSARAATNALVAIKEEARLSQANPRNATEPFWGRHQGGILTPLQSHTYFAAFDLSSTKKDEVMGVLPVKKRP